MDLSGIDVEEPRKSRRYWPLLLVVLVAIGAAVYRFLPLVSPEAPQRVVPAPPVPVAPMEEALPREPARAPVPPPAPIAEATAPSAAAPAPLPPLDASDALVRKLASGLSRRPALAEWLVSDELIRRFVASVDNIAEGQSPRSHIGFMGPASRFPVLAGGERVLVAPRAGERYDTVAAVFVSIDARGAARLYRRLRPLVDEAWAELGYPDRDFDEALEAAFTQLLGTPILQGPVELVPLIVSHAYADPELEELAPAQKLLLRMGTANQSRVQSKLRELAAALGMDTEALPTVSLYRPLTLAEVEARAESNAEVENEVEAAR